MGILLGAMLAIVALLLAIGFLTFFVAWMGGDASARLGMFLLLTPFCWFVAACSLQDAMFHGSDVIAWKSYALAAPCGVFAAWMIASWPIYIRKFG